MTTTSDARARPLGDKKSNRKPDMAMYVPKGRRQPFGWPPDGHADGLDGGGVDSEKSTDASADSLPTLGMDKGHSKSKSSDEDDPTTITMTMKQQSPPLISFDAIPTPPPSANNSDGVSKKAVPPPPQPQPNKLPSQIIREIMLKSGLVADDKTTTALSASASASEPVLVPAPLPPLPPVNSAPLFDASASASSSYTVPSLGDHALPGVKPVSSSFLAPPSVVDQGDSILDCLPTSYDEFETTELHLRLERQISSPLTSPTGVVVSPQVGGFGPRALSGNVGGSSPPPDAEDMEVAMINESFEEQQKQTQLYDSADLRYLFYSRPNANQSTTVKSTASSDHSGSSSVFDQSPALIHLAPAGVNAVNVNAIAALALPDPLQQLPKPAIAWAGWGKKLHPPTPPDTPKAADFASPPAACSLTPTTDLSRCPAIGNDASTTAEMLAVDMAEKLLEDDDDEETDVAQSFNSSPSLEVFVENTADADGEPDSTEPAPDPDPAPSAQTDQPLPSAPVADSLPSSSSADCFFFNDDYERDDRERPDGSGSSTSAFADLFSSRDATTNAPGGVVADDSTVDSWEQLCDETGELDPKVIQEINWALGKVKVEQPTFDYLSFKPKPVEIEEDELAHVLEIYGFPKATKTDDLRAALTDLNCRHFDVKWVDDDHALAVFASADAAFELRVGSHHLIKLRPLSAATPQSQRKAKQSAEFLQPYKPRPPTNALLARRMVETALGKRSSASTEQRTAERQQLVDAKERKQRVAALWEGNV